MTSVAPICKMARLDLLGFTSAAWWFVMVIMLLIISNKDGCMQYWITEVPFVLIASFSYMTINLWCDGKNRLHSQETLLDILRVISPTWGHFDVPIPQLIDRACLDVELNRVIVSVNAFDKIAAYFN